MMTVHRILQFIMATTIVAVLVLALPASRLVAQETNDRGEGQQSSLPETFSAFAIVMGAIGTGNTESLMIRITRWTTPEERENLLATIIENPNDQEALRRALQKQEETGFIRALDSSSAGWPSERLRYAWQWQEEGTGKRRIVLALDRPLGFVELWASTRSLEYPVTLIVLDVDENGEGDGILSVGTKIIYDEALERLIIEHYATEPVRLTNVHKTS